MKSMDTVRPNSIRHFIVAPFKPFLDASIEAQDKVFRVTSATLIEICRGAARLKRPLPATISDGTDPYWQPMNRLHPHRMGLPFCPP